MLNFKCCGLIQSVICPQLFHTSKCKYQEITAEVLDSSGLIFISRSSTQMCLVNNRNKETGLVVPTLLEGTVRVHLQKQLDNVNMMKNNVKMMKKNVNMMMNNVNMMKNKVNMMKS